MPNDVAAALRAEATADPEVLLADAIDALAAGRLPSAATCAWLAAGLRDFACFRGDPARHLQLRGRPAVQARCDASRQLLAAVIHAEAAGRVLSTRAKARLVAGLLAGELQPVNAASAAALQEARQRGAPQSTRHLMRLFAEPKPASDRGVTLAALLCHWRPTEES